jgi:hypothetical protein
VPRRVHDIDINVLRWDCSIAVEFAQTKRGLENAGDRPVEISFCEEALVERGLDVVAIFFRVLAASTTCSRRSRRVASSCPGSRTANQLQPADRRSILSVCVILSLLCTRGEFSQSVSVPARILSATAEEIFPVKLCPVGSSFSIAWQSLTTSPSKPHRSRSRSVRNSEFAQLGTPFTESTREIVDCVVSIGFVNRQVDRQQQTGRRHLL